MKMFIPLALAVVIAIASTAESSSSKSGELDLSKCTEVIHFYLHDQSNTSAIVLPPLNNQTFFGMVGIIDDKLTEEPSIHSKLVGRAKGFLVSDSLSSPGFLQSMTVELEGRNGTIVFNGHNPFTAPHREVAIVGGTGEFRNVQGYALTSTVGSEPGGNIAVYEVHLLRLWKCFNLLLV